MSRQVHTFEHPARFVAGTVGQPGDRTFYLQASDALHTVSVVLEKVQVSLLAERLAELLEEVRSRLGVAVPDEGTELDLEPLDVPVEEEFRVGAMGLAWDPESNMVVVEAHAQVEDTESEPPDPLVDTPEGPDTLRVKITPDAARSFVERAERVIAAGRPPCPLCGQPLDPAGHICPRQNGYRRGGFTP
jgi:uncharacterized repeat protein (TIGR03847 family)